MLEKIDFKKTQGDLYRATSKVKHVNAGKGAFLAVSGQGAPGGETYQSAIQQIFSVAYTLKFTVLKEGTLDFVVPPLETLWLDDPKQVPDMKDWHWMLMVRVPEQITQEQVAGVKRAVAAKGTRADDVKLITWDEGDSLQVMHIGPYDKVGTAYSALHAAAASEGLSLTGYGREIYLSDPRRTAPDKLKTIVRMPVAPRPS